MPTGRWPVCSSVQNSWPLRSLVKGRPEGARCRAPCSWRTAVKHDGGVLHRAPSGRPFTSDLSGQEFWTLLATGHRPVGMVMGSCVYHVAHQSLRQSMRNMGQNVELANYTQALYDARELAMERMQAEALEAKAEGIVGVDLHERSHGWGSHVIEFFAIGTAIIPAEGAQDHVIAAPQTVLDLS